ncbi:MAG: transcription elongation factor GreA [Actinomycetota bacterium]|nr:transcription elongation factor GreA [Actinomycetota bacterium]
MDREVILTEEGFNKLEDEIEHLTTKTRREVAERIKTAREFGDISENSEYDDAKNEQARVESRIIQIEHQLRNARIIDTHDVPTDVVSIGVKVTVRTTADKKTMSFSVVGSAEADPLTNRLSNESPIGKALMGRKKGDKVTVVSPRGQVEYRVVKIEAED